ncbi:hypothetical protein [Deinococcus sonorensis]|uniref:Uncharacterized protein n=2 Tax=Deinococcus sonorensis TaxID=309891 RepID=A0AAU7UBJ4_9DEIO
MPLPPDASALHDSELLRELRRACQASPAERDRALRRCVEHLAPLLYGLAARFELEDVEDSIAEVLRDLCRHCEQQRVPAMPVQLWVLGLAQRHFARRAEAGLRG